MNSIQKRFILFLCGCMFVRTLLVIIAKNYPQYLPMMGIPALLIAMGFFYIYLFDKRKTGGEVLGEKIWWNHLRPIHGSLYVIFSIMALQENKDAWIVLLLDVIIGLGAFLHFHYVSGNFQYLF